MSGVNFAIGSFLVIGIADMFVQQQQCIHATECMCLSVFMYLYQLPYDLKAHFLHFDQRYCRILLCFANLVSSHQPNYECVLSVQFDTVNTHTPQGVLPIPARTEG
jgi:hypothetical protein